MPKPDYDTTIARMAGNIAGALWATNKNRYSIAAEAVAIAREIVAEVKRTAPKTIDENIERYGTSPPQNSQAGDTPRTPKETP